MDSSTAGQDVTIKEKSRDEHPVRSHRSVFSLRNTYPSREREREREHWHWQRRLTGTVTVMRCHLVAKGSGYSSLLLKYELLLMYEMSVIIIWGSSLRINVNLMKQLIHKQSDSTDEMNDVHRRTDNVWKSGERSVSESLGCPEWEMAVVLTPALVVLLDMRSQTISSSKTNSSASRNASPPATTTYF